MRGELAAQWPVLLDMFTGTHALQLRLPLTFRMAKGSKFSMPPTLCFTNLQVRGHGCEQRLSTAIPAALWNISTNCSVKTASRPPSHLLVADQMSSAQASQASIMRPEKVARRRLAQLSPFLSPPFLLCHVLTRCGQRVQDAPVCGQATRTTSWQEPKRRTSCRRMQGSQPIAMAAGVGRHDAARFPRASIRNRSRNRRGRTSASSLPPPPRRQRV